MTNLEWIKQASAEDLAIELVLCKKFFSAVDTKQWLLQEREENLSYNLDEVLELAFFSTDLDKFITVREFLKKILSTFIIEREQFSSKRPFGNSDWDSDLIKLFIKMRIIKGTVDEYDDIEDFDNKKFNLILQKLIKEL